MDDTPKIHEPHTHAGGYIAGAEGVPAFVLHTHEPSSIPVLIAAPHAGRAYPPEILQDLQHGESTGVRLEDRHADQLAQAVARMTGANLLLADAPRAMVDLNRAPEDVDWDMFVRADRPASPLPAPSRRARTGLGLIPRRLPGTGNLWRRQLTGKDLADRLDGIHRPYHAALEQALSTLRQRWGAALLIDLHSMPPLPRGAGAPKVEIVIGDQFGASCHGSLAAAAFSELARSGRGTAHNRPYAGGYVLERHASPGSGVHAMQIEIDRSCYLNSRLLELGSGFSGMVKDIGTLVSSLASIVAELGQGDAWPKAAE